MRADVHRGPNDVNHRKLSRALAARSTSEGVGPERRQRPSSDLRRSPAPAKDRPSRATRLLASESTPRGDILALQPVHRSRWTACRRGSAAPPTMVLEENVRVSGVSPPAQRGGKPGSAQTVDRRHGTGRKGRARRSHMRHRLGRHQPIQPSNGRFYSLQPPPPGPATPGGSLAARGRPQCRSGPRAPAHPCAGAAGARRKLLPETDGGAGASRGQATLPWRRSACDRSGRVGGLRSQKTAVLPCDSLKVAGRSDAGL